MTIKTFPITEPPDHSDTVAFVMLNADDSVKHVTQANYRDGDWFGGEFKAALKLDDTCYWFEIPKSPQGRRRKHLQVR